MLLKNKVAVIYGAAGAMGAAVSRAFAREGAHVCLAGHSLEKVEALATEITDAGGSVLAAVVDARDKHSIESHLDKVINEFGSVDISFNLIGLGDAQGAPLVEMSQSHFALPIVTAMETHFLTSTAAGRIMARQGAGVILALTANVARKPEPVSGGFGVACAAIEGLCRQLAAELSPSGVRVVCLRSAGSPDTPGVQEAMRLHAANEGLSLDEFITLSSQKTLLKRLPLLAEVANAAVLMASDYSSTITGAVINVTCGEIVD